MAILKDNKISEIPFLFFRLRIAELEKHWKLISNIFDNEKQLLFQNQDLLVVYWILEEGDEDIGYLSSDEIDDILDQSKELTLQQFYVLSFVYFEDLLNNVIEVVKNQNLKSFLKKPKTNVRINLFNFVSKKITIIQEGNNPHKIDFICKILELDRNDFSVLVEPRNRRNSIVHSNDQKEIITEDYFFKVFSDMEKICSLIESKMNQI